MPDFSSAKESSKCEHVDSGIAYRLKMALISLSPAEALTVSTLSSGNTISIPHRRSTRSASAPTKKGSISSAAPALIASREVARSVGSDSLS